MRKSKYVNYKRREKLKDFLCVVPALIFLVIFVYYPVADLINISFTDWNLLRETRQYVGPKNYIWLFNGSGFDTWVKSLKITAVYTFWEIMLTLVGGLGLALLFNRENKAFSFMRSAVFMPKYIAVATSGIVFIWILNGDYGVLNKALSVFGFSPPDWLNSEKYALTGVLFLTAWRVVGYSMMLYLSAMRGISQDYYEAAALDGANGAQRFFHITFPMLSPTTLFMLVTTFIASMKVFQSIDVMTHEGGPYGATSVMVYWIYWLAFRDFRVDRASAVSVVFFFILLIFTALTMRVSKNTVNYDS